MSRRLFFISFLLFGTATASFGQFTNDYHMEPKEKGKFDTIITSHYFASGEKVLRSKSVAVFNKKGQKIETYQYSYGRNTDNGTVNKKPLRQTISYDKKGNMTALIAYDINDSLESKESFIYPSKSIIEIKYTDHFNHQITPTSQMIKLDSVGKIIEMDLYKSDSSGNKLILSKKFYKYAKDKLIETERSYFKYDSYGNLSEVGSLSGGKDVMTYTYTNYDKYHNWQVRNQYYNNNGKLVEITERRIVYAK